MNTIKISVIIPVYNNEQYLSQCIDSVLQQSFSDLEVIVINDASTDSSTQLIQHYALLDSRINFINLEKNSGVSSARNTGIEIARGKYLIFIDADDYWSDSQVLDTLYHKIENVADDEPAEFITFGFCRVDESAEQKKVVVQQPEIIQIRRAKRWKIQYSVCTKLISKKHLDDHGIRFDESLVMGEDALFSVRLYSTANKVIITDNVFYCYRINPSGANNMVWDNKKLFDTVRWFSLAIDVLLSAEVRCHNTDVVQSLLIERLIMLFNVLGPKAITMLTHKDQAAYFDQWCHCIRYLEDDTVEHYFQSNRIRSLYNEILEYISQRRLAAVKDFFTSDRYLNRDISEVSNVQLSREQAIQLANDLLKTNNDQIRCNFGNKKFITLPKDRAHQLARQLLENDKDVLNLKFD